MPAPNPPPLDPTKPPPQIARESSRTKPQARFDWQDWLPYLAEIDAPEAYKRQLIEQYWAIILTFVDLGWEVSDGRSLAPEESCGQVLDLGAALRAAVVHSEGSPTEESEEA